MVRSGFYWWLALLAILQLLDLVTTLGALSIGFAEANPLITRAIGEVGPAVLVPIKLFAIGAMILVVLSVPPRSRSRVAGIGIVLSGTIVANNLLAISNSILF